MYHFSTDEGMARKHWTFVCIERSDHVHISE